MGSPPTGQPINTYNTRAAWSLTRAHEITSERRFFDAALRNCERALTQAQPSGWLAHKSLQDDAQPFTHTIAYAIRGLLEVGACAEREEFLAAARRLGDATSAALPAGGQLLGRFDARWGTTARWSCLTGDRQFGLNWGRLFQLTGEPKYRAATTQRLAFVKRTQRLTGDDPNTRGGIKGSHPIDGGYHPWQYPNWATKFFADSLMMDGANRAETGFAPYVITGPSRSRSAA